MHKHLIILSIWLSCVCASAQNAQPQLEPGQQTEKAPPTITFTCSFPNFKPPFYNIAVESTGRAEYKSTPEPNNVGDPYLLKFTVSEGTRTRLFQLAEELNHFQGNFDYTKNKIAYTGTKTLAWKNGEDEHQTSYNWSENPTVQEVTTIFQSMEETIELGRQLEDKYRFDKLGVDAVLKAMEEEAKANRMSELQAIQPILTKVAKDSALMNISRRRAEFLLTKVPRNASVTTNGGRP